MEPKNVKILDAPRRCEKGSIAVCRGCSYWDTCERNPYAVASDAADLIERLSAELEQVKRERDAAIYDAGHETACGMCKFRTVEPENEPCRSCSIFGIGEDAMWEWRGVCAENRGGAENE